MSFLPFNVLSNMGFRALGKNVLISDKASFYRPENISIGNNTRIDDYCILSAGDQGIFIGSHVHIACYVSLIGKERITIEDFAGVSSRCAIYSSNDDYSGNYLTGPTVPAEFTNVSHASVLLQKHVVVGAGSIILPGVTIGMGSAIGVLSLVNKDIESFSIYAGVPAKKIKDRSRDLLALEKKLMS